MNNKNQVWIVDDDVSIRWVLELALVEVGHTVRQCGNADEATEMLNYERPHVVICGW